MTTPGSTNDDSNNSRLSRNFSEETLRKFRRIGMTFNFLSALHPALAGKAAYRMFCTPRRPPVKEQETAFLDAADRRRLHLDGLRIQEYIWHSKKEIVKGSVLLLHGWESSSARWMRFVKPLREAGYRVIALDAPAQGRSSGRIVNLPIYSRVVAAYLREHGVPDAVVGHSLGGSATVMSMAAFGAPLVPKAVLMGAFADSHRVIREYGGLLQLKPVVLEAVFDRIHRVSGLPLDQYSVSQQASRLKDRVQGLVIHDRDDMVSPAAEGRAIAEAWGAAYIETEGLGHRLQDNSVVKLLLRFIEENQ